MVCRFWLDCPVRVCALRFVKKSLIYPLYKTRLAHSIPPISLFTSPFISSYFITPLGCHVPHPAAMLPHSLTFFPLLASFYSALSFSTTFLFSFLAVSLFSTFVVRPLFPFLFFFSAITFLSLFARYLSLVSSQLSCFAMSLKPRSLTA
jgi:hypothetical protein